MSPAAILGEPRSQVRDEVGRLDENQAVVDGVAFEDVTERTADNDRDPGVFDSRCGLFSRGARSKVVACQKNWGVLRSKARLQIANKGGKRGVVVF
jgi:hypothetical protein